MPTSRTRGLAARYRAVRAASERLCEPLQIEDYGLQSMADASPTKWHLAHTSWFFETFVLEPGDPAYRPFAPDYRMLFNSYYETVGPQFPRDRRGLLSRPSVAEVVRYRGAVDERVLGRLDAGRLDDEQRRALVLGLEHEQQHQELMLTDILHLFSCNPLRPAYRPAVVPPTGTDGGMAWVAQPGGQPEIGHEGPAFAFDNEMPRHPVILNPFELGSRAVTNAEWIAFIDDSGYRRPELWLAAGWATRQRLGWCAPEYWEQEAGEWKRLTLRGMRDIAAHEPVCHVSFYEADAFARWCGARLPTEHEWEAAAANHPITGNFVERDTLHPMPADDASTPLRQLFGDVWEWTASPYVAYPGYRPPVGALGEYNGKFMCNQIVLRGGSCATPQSHMRASYRNFFPPEARWQFSGVRLARDAP